MDFAKNLLSKYGWEEGQGIGKNADGIAKPIKVALKFDKTGLGHDRGAEFTDHWWEKTFNEAASNIDIQNSGENVSMSSKKKSPETETSGSSDYKNSFLKSAFTLNREITVADSDAEDDASNEMATKSSSTSFGLTDDDLLKACGGRTAHKGARHGLSLSGKLSRIEEQERQLLQNFRSDFNGDSAPEVFKNWIRVDSKKEKKKSQNSSATSRENVTSPDSEKLTSLLNGGEYVMHTYSKTKSKKHKRLDSELASALENLHTEKDGLNDANENEKLHRLDDSSKKIKKKKKKKNKVRNDNLGTLATSDQSVHFEENVPKKKTSKKKSNGTEIVIKPKALITSSPEDENNDKNPLIRQIKAELAKRPTNKKYKVVVKNMTQIQMDNLTAAGIKFVERKNGGKGNSEIIEINRITRRLANSMSLDEDSNEADDADEAMKELAAELKKKQQKKKKQKKRKRKKSVETPRSIST